MCATIRFTLKTVASPAGGPDTNQFGEADDTLEENVTDNNKKKKERKKEKEKKRKEDKRTTNEIICRGRLDGGHSKKQVQSAFGLATAILALGKIL